MTRGGRTAQAISAPRVFTATWKGRPAAMIFVGGEFGCLKLDRIVSACRRGYAVYRPGEETPFLISRELGDAIGAAG